MDKLAQHGMGDFNRHTPPWKPMLGKHIRGIVHFDMQPTDLQNDIKGTDNCELWNRQVNLIGPPPVQETTHYSEQYGKLANRHKQRTGLQKSQFPS